ncbi:MAG: haloalkane dehalogenase [Litorimonas sp.]
MKSLRTPDDWFENLPDYDFAPNYCEIRDGLRLHYVDEGPRSARTIILMHGEPSWSFLYRFMIRQLTEAGYRVLAPDLIGFGKSDKPTELTDYSYKGHVAWMQDWLDQMNVSDAVLFCQDWGGLIGLRLVADNPDRFAAVMAGNTGLPVGKGTPSEAFLKWQEFSQTIPVFPTGQILQGATVRDLTPDEVAAYDAPYPDETYKAGARIFPALVPTDPSMAGVAENIEAWKILSAWNKPFLTGFSDQDPVTKGGENIFQKLVPGAKGQPHTILKGGGHFLQEDVHAELSEMLIALCEGLG